MCACKKKTAAANNPYGGYSNDSYQQPTPQAYPYQQQQDSPFRDDMSPFEDEAGGAPANHYRDNTSDEGATPVYAARTRVQNQNQRGYDAPVGYAS